jgi:hypothetical protein
VTIEARSVLSSDPTSAFTSPADECKHTRSSPNGTAATIFSFYSDELAFSEAELRGLTAAEARSLRHARDVKYLQS